MIVKFKKMRVNSMMMCTSLFGIVWSCLVLFGLVWYCLVLLLLLLLRFINNKLPYKMFNEKGSVSDDREVFQANSITLIFPQCISCVLENCGGVLLFVEASKAVHHPRLSIMSVL